MRLKIVSAFLALLLFFPFHISASAENMPTVSAAACVVMAEDGQCVYEKNADTKCLIASTTKLMTALVCLEIAELEEPVFIKPEHCAVEGSSMYLRAGENYTVKDLLLGLLLASGNDAALALAEHTAGSEAAFVAMMNQRAEEIGLSGTHFSNPHGLDDPEHYSTARDLGKLMLACMDNAVFQTLTGTYAAQIHGSSFINHNKLLQTCPGCIGGKTGYTSAAGRCLVSCCKRDGLTFVCVTLSDPDDWRDHQMLYDWAFDRYQLLDLTESMSFQVPVVSGSRDQVLAVPAQEFCTIVRKDQTVELHADLPKFVFAPIKKGETAGKVWIIIDQKKTAEIPLFYSESIEIAYPVYKPEDKRVVYYDRKIAKDHIDGGNHVKAVSGRGYSGRSCDCQRSSG